MLWPQSSFQHGAPTGYRLKLAAALIEALGCSGAVGHCMVLTADFGNLFEPLLDFSENFESRTRHRYKKCIELINTVVGLCQELRQASWIVG